MEEAAQNLGASGFRLFRRIVFPLAMPGYVAGASLVFVKVFDDLGTPLVLGTSPTCSRRRPTCASPPIGLEDPIGYVISVIMIVFSVGALWMSARILKGRDYATLQRGGGVAAAAAARRRGRRSLAYGWIAPRAAARAVAAPRHPAAVALEGVELLACCPKASRCAHYATGAHASRRA